MDYTSEIAAMRQRVASGHALLAQQRLAACMGSRLALTLFVSATGPELVGATTTEAEALARLKDNPADVLLCTDRLEQGNGGSLVAAAKRLNPALSTLMIVTQPRRLAVIRTAQQAGCEGLCLESQIGHGTVFRALGIVMAGAMYLEQGLSEQYWRVYAGLGKPPLDRKSTRLNSSHRT